jgi:DNA-binding response OmpR family regulator
VVLVVEDELLLCEPIKDALIDGGFEPVFAKSGEEAADMLKSEEHTYNALLRTLVSARV